ncbi:PQQ-binding-like beta-propeller repeat protein [Haloarcula litorea]|uniref:PQQ-binding-like beta-propeller repeat protein n=1 Tax=Haloarcula litorea TaxID=3032579 RepID=UPI0023E7A4A0|nr:PQQ-binding-like beta-propeller repeat protein [Halomicroarcula sp. GDY20]
MTEYTRRSLLATLGAVGTASIGGCLTQLTGGPRHERVAWRRSPEGTIGSLAVVDGALVALTTWRTLAFDPGTGDERWRVLLDDPGDTVCYDAGLAGATGPDGRPLAVVAGCDGTRAFEHLEGTQVWGRPDASSLAPIAATDDAVYLSEGGVTAVDAADGSVRWRALEGDVSTAGATSDAVYVGRADGTLHALSAADGSERWSTDVGPGRVERPTAVDGTVYVPTGRPDDDSGDLFALSAADGSEQWRVDTGQALSDSRPVLAGDTVLVGTASGSLHAHRRDTGERRWRFDAEDWLVTQPAVGPDGATAYVGSNDGNAYAVSMADGSEQWTVPVGYSSVAPVVRGDRVFVGSHDGLFALRRGELE